MKKYIPHMSLSWNLKGRSGWFKKFQLYLKNYDFCEYVKFVNMWKFFGTNVTHIIVIIWRTQHLVSTSSIFS